MYNTQSEPAVGLQVLNHMYEYDYKHKVFDMSVWCVNMNVVRVCAFNVQCQGWPQVDVLPVWAKSQTNNTGLFFSYW